MILNIMLKSWNETEHPRNANGQFSNKKSIQQKRIELANKAPLLKNISLLKFTRKNWKSVITNAMNNLEYTLKNNNIFCTYLGKQVTDCNKTHIYLKNGKVRPIVDIINHASFIPFIIPVLQNGIVDITQDRLLKTGELTSEVVCRADIKTNNGIERIGVSVVVVHNFNNVSLKTISVFRIKDNQKLIKSCPPQAQRGLSGFHGNVLQDSINKSACNRQQIKPNARKAPKGMADLTPYADSQLTSAFNNSSLTDCIEKSSNKKEHIYFTL